MCPLDLALTRPDIWLNIISWCALRVFLDELHTSISRLNKADGPQPTHCGAGQSNVREGTCVLPAVGAGT